MGEHTGLKIDVDGTVDWTTWQLEDSLPVLQEHVGGAVDVVSLTDDVDMWLNDSGMIHCDFNPTATRLARMHGKVYQPYFGPVVISGQRDGETIGLSETAMAWLRAWLEQRCTALFERNGQVVHCGADFNHPGLTHQTLLGQDRVIWHGQHQPTLAALTGAVA